jgi:hypothetical protein
VARCRDLQSRTPADQVDEERRRGGDVLEVVEEQQQQLGLAKMLPEPLEQVAVRFEQADRHLDKGTSRDVERLG